MTPVDVQCLDCCTTGSEVNLLAADLEVVLRIASVEDKALRGAGDRVFDEGAGVAEPARRVERCAPLQCPLEQNGWHFGHADLGKDTQGGLQDLPNLTVAQRAIATADGTGRTGVELARRGGARCNAGGAAAAASADTQFFAGHQALKATGQTSKSFGEYPDPMKWNSTTSGFWKSMFR